MHPCRASRRSAPSLWSRLRQVDFERRLALLLTVSAVAAGLATYWLISRSPPYGPDVGTVLVLLNLDLILLLLLGVVIARRLVQLVFQLRQGSAGSRLHTRLVLLFSGVAVTPAIIVVIFSVFFLSSGLENWFSERVRNALDNSLAVAQAYLQEHKDNIRADALAMAADLNRESASLDFNSARLRQVVNAQAALRSLTEAIVFDGSGRILARTGLSFTMEVDQIPVGKIEEASAGNVVEVTSDTEDRVRALVRLDGFGDAYLYRRPVRRRQGAGLHGTHPDHGRRISADAERAIGHPDHLGADLHDRRSALAVRLGLDRLGAGQSAGRSDQPTDHCRQPGAQRRSSGPGAGGGP